LKQVPHRGVDNNSKDQWKRQSLAQAGKQPGPGMTFELGGGLLLQDLFRQGLSLTFRVLEKGSYLARVL
jgi:hypothetical protein